MTTTIKNGEVIDPKVKLKRFKSLEHGKLRKMDAIVLHRTDSSTASSTLSQYGRGEKVGAHFLIAKTGQIYQTASMLEECWHVGTMLSRCRIEKDCGKSELKTVDALLFQKGVSFHDRAINLSRHERAKAYPKRYPANTDSIGIEVVGLYLKHKKQFATPTAQQLASAKWLVKLIVTHYKLNLKKDVYAHVNIARKSPGEGVQVLQAIESGK